MGTAKLLGNVMSINMLPLDRLFRALEGWGACQSIKSFKECIS